MSHFESKEIQFERPLDVDEFISFIYEEAKAIIQRGYYPPTFVAVFGTKAEVYTINPTLGAADRETVLDSLKALVQEKRPQRVSYTSEVVLRHTLPSDPQYADIMSGKIDVNTLPGAFRALCLTIQDPARYWQFVYNIVQLEDKTRYPGELVMGQDPRLPPGGPVPTGKLFYGPPPGTPRIELN
jgi:hypothetical protein